jgi:hypothetical protein
LLHHQNRKDVLGNDNGNPKDFFFPTNRLHLLVYISMPVICLQWKGELLFLWHPTCKLEMKAQTVGEAVPVPAPAPWSSASNTSILCGACEHF